MPGFDAHANFCYGTVLTSPSPAISGTSLTLSSGVGALCPAAPFNMSVRTANAPYTYEIVRVTAVVGDVLTITRAQEGTSAYAIAVGDAIANTITKKVITDVEAATFEEMEVAVPASSSATGTLGQWAFDDGYFYRCIATDTWIKYAVADFF